MTISQPIPTQTSLPPFVWNFPQAVQHSPFRHVCQQDFLKPEVYQRLCAEFERIKAQGLVDAHSRSRFSRFEDYDCYNYCIPAETDAPLDWVWSPLLRDAVSALFQVPLTHDLVGSMHHHLPGSVDGWIHNDYVTYPFQNRRLASGMNPYYIRKGQTISPDSLRNGLVYRRMRSIVLIYFLNNPDWQPGMGGETGLFTHREATEAAVLVPPVNNSLLAFEISPGSWHAFRSNKVERNSIILWYHTMTEDKMALHDGIAPIF